MTGELFHRVGCQLISVQGMEELENQHLTVIIVMTDSGNPNGGHSTK